MLEADPTAPERTGCGCTRPAVGPEGAEHQRAPDRQPREEADLPGAAELDVGKALLAEPEPALLHVAHDVEIIARERAGDDGHRHPEERVDEPGLPFRLGAADGRRQEERRADPRHADP